MNRIALGVYLGSVLFGVLFFGAIHTWVYTIVFLGILTASVLFIGKEAACSAKTRRLAWIRTGLTPLFLFFAAYLVLQMLPLPPPSLGMISPEAELAGKMSQPAALVQERLSYPWFSLAPYAYPVRMSLVRWIVYALFFLGLCRCLDSRKRIEAAVVTILVLCCFDALYGIMQAYSGNPHIWWFKLANKDVSGTYLNRNHFAGLMEMGVVLAVAYATALGKTGELPTARSLRPRPFKKRFLAVFAAERRGIRQFLVIFAGGITGLGLILSASRGGILAAAGALFLMGLLLSLRSGAKRKWKVIIGLSGIALIFGLYAGLDYTVERFDSFDRDLEVRLIRAERTIDLFRDYRYAGAGIGNFRHAYGKYQHPRDIKYYVDYAHNDYAQFLAEAGIAGAALLIIGMGWYLGRTFRQWRLRNDPFAVCLGIAPFGALAAIAIHSVSDFNLHRPANVLVLIAVMAIGYAALNLKGRHRHSPVEYPQRLIPLWPWGGIVLACAAGAILWSGVWTVRHFIGEVNCSTDYNVTLNLEQNPPAEDIRTAIAWDPANAAYPHKLALALTADRDRRMQQPAPDTEGWKRSHGPIIEALQRSIRLNPLNAQLHVQLGWEYSYLFDRPDHATRWLPAADLCMERAAWFAGDWVQYPRLQYDMGNYWTMRSKTFGPGDPKGEISWTRAVWHYRKGMEIERAASLPEDVKGYIRNFYADGRPLPALQQ